MCALVVLDKRCALESSLGTTLEKTGATKVAVRVQYEKCQFTAFLWASCDVQVQGHDLVVKNYYFEKPLVVFKGTGGASHKNSVETLVREAVSSKPAAGAVSS